RYEIKQNKNCASWLIQQLEEEKRPGRIEVLNPRYAFRLQRTSPDAPWAVAGISVGLEEGYTLGPLPPDISVGAGLVDMALTFSSIHERLPELIKDPDFRITGAKTVAREGVEWIRVDFTNRPKITEPQQIGKNTIRGAWNPLREGWFLLDPAHYWVMREY